MPQLTLSEIAESICAFLRLPREEVYRKVTRESLHPGIHVAEAWRSANPTTEEEVQDFYRTTDSYIYDLMVEGARDVRQQWRGAILEVLRSRENLSRVLDFGAGVANEVLFLASHGYEVTYYDVEGLTRDFARYRIAHHPDKDRIKIASDRTELATSEGYDAIICLEVLEHLSDPLDTLDFLRSILKPDGLILLTQAFGLVGPDYPSHLIRNRELAATFDEECFKLGLVVLDRIGPEQRIAVIEHMKPVDVIIPVYNGYEVLRECLESIRKNPDALDHRLVFVDDGSDDPRVLGLLEEARRRDGAVVIRHDSRLGFAMSVDDAFSLSRHDVVILNSDTKVTPGWLTKLARAAYRRHDIATVTPLSNNASIFSLPIMDPLPPHVDVNEVGLEVESTSPKVYPRIPVGVGFCMFIKRNVLDRVGHFDSEEFGSGYGEETEFCLRASRHGYCHVLADDTYVHHRGSQSFSRLYSDKEIREMRQGADRRLFEAYPAYEGAISQFKRKNPLGLHRELLRNHNASRLTDKPRVLLVVNNPIEGGYIGGIEFHVEDLVRHLGNHFAFYLLWCRRNAVVLDEYLRYSYSRFVFELEQPLEPRMLSHHELRNYVKKIIQAFSIDLIHVHHIMHGTLDPIDIGHLCGIPVLVSVHDYYMLCPNYNLLDQSGAFCGVPSDVEKCRRCLSAGKDMQTGFSVHQWRERIREKLALTDMFVFPSKAALDVFSLVYEASPHLIVAHGTGEGEKHLDPARSEGKTAEEPAPSDAFSVCFLGYPAPQKGKYLMEQAVPQLVRAGLTVHFLGSRANDWPEEWKAFGNSLIFHGPYSRGQVVNTLRELSPHLVLLPSPWPETFGYVLSEAMAAGIPAIVPPLGALSERVAQAGSGAIMDEVSPEALVRTVLSIRSNPSKYHEIFRRAQEVRLKSVAEMAGEYRHLYSTFTSRRNKVVGPSTGEACAESLAKPEKRDGRRPVVSIVMHGQHRRDVLLRCIEAIRRNTRIPFELILVGSEGANGIEGLTGIVEEEPGMRVVYSPPGSGFSYSVNKALTVAQGSYLVVMHPDILVPQGWLEPLLVALQQVGVGVAGPKSNYAPYAPGEQLVTQPIPPCQDAESIEMYSKEAATDNAGGGRFTHRLGDFCIVIKRSLLDKIGGFDPSFVSGSIAVADFCLRAQAAGYRAWVAEDSIVYHFEGSSEDETTTLGILRSRDIPRLNSKWGTSKDSRLYEETFPYSSLSSSSDPEWYHCPLTPTSLAFRVGEPLPLLESRRVHFLMCPQWDDSGDRWVEALRAFTTAFDPDEDVGLLIRIDPMVYSDLGATVEQINLRMSELDIDLDSGWLLLIVNDPVPPARRGIIYHTSHVFINTAPADGFSYAAEEARACGLICCEPSREHLKHAYAQVLSQLETSNPD
ncbi:MAG: glycosyltransferase [Bacillota bacterium]